MAYGSAGAGGLLFLGPLLMILFRQKSRAIPHYIVLFFLDIGAFFAVVVTWFAILFTDRYPSGLFSFIEGVFRWHNRVVAYAFTLVTDQYPPFKLAP